MKLHQHLFWGLLFFAVWIGGLYWWGLLSNASLEHATHTSSSYIGDKHLFVAPRAPTTNATWPRTPFATWSKNTHVRKRKIALLWMGTTRASWSLEALHTHLPRLMPLEVIRLKRNPQDIPWHAVIRFPRARKIGWLAEPLLSWLAKRKPKGVSLILAVTNIDVMSKSGKALQPVFGLADFGGPAAVISTKRLLEIRSLRKEYRRMWLQLAVHEIGHLLGLHHCKRPTCVMHDANAKPAKLLRMSGRLCERCNGDFLRIYRSRQAKREGLQ